MTHRITYRVQRWSRACDVWAWLGVVFIVPDEAVEEMHRMGALFPNERFRVVEHHEQEVVYRVPPANG